jgi:hypothetical protein
MAPALDPTQLTMSRRKPISNFDDVPGSRSTWVSADVPVSFRADDHGTQHAGRAHQVHFIDETNLGVQYLVVQSQEPDKEDLVESRVRQGPFALRSPERSAHRSRYKKTNKLFQVRPDSPLDAGRQLALNVGAPNAVS